MLSQALCRAAGQARKTVHPLAKARHIRDVASAAATVHPDQFGERAGMGTVNGDAQQRLQIALVQVFGDVKGFTLGGDEQPARLPAGGELAENPALPTSTPALPEV